MDGAHSENLANHVRESRTRLGVTQVELARLLDVSNVTVNRWERGKSIPSSAKLNRLSLLTRHGITAHPVTSPDLKQSGRLPESLTSFFGRDALVVELAGAIDSSPVVTLTGPGGSGKTRLAIETARRVVDRFSGGVTFVDLAPLSDDRLLEELVVRTVAPVGDPRMPAIDRLRFALENRSWLLLLDNCEHVLDPAGRFIERLLNSPAPPRILATSRVSLGVQNELAWSVPPLALDSEGEDSPAVRLFLSRARSADPSFTRDSADAAVVLDICRRLDGLPLGIELAAARAPLLTAMQIRERLASGAQLLSDDSRTSVRHRTLESTIAWGFDLLNRREQELFERIAVFAGSFDLEAVDAIRANGSEQLSAIDGIAALVKHSMLVVDRNHVGERRRYRMLETLRAFALNRPRDQGEKEALRDRHAAHFLDRVEQAQVELLGPEQSRWLDLLEADEDNLREAMAYAESLEESERFLRFVAGLWRFWSVRGRIGEGRIWTERALAHPDPGPLKLRAEALRVAGNLANDQGDHASAPRLYEASLTAYRELGDRKGEVRSLSNLSIVSSMQGDFAGAKARLEEAITLAHDLGDDRLLANTLHNLAVVEEHRGYLELAAERYAESRAVFQKLGDQAGFATVLNNMGNIARAQGDLHRAEQLYRESLVLRESIGDVLGVASCLHNLGVASRVSGNDDSANAYLELSLARSRELGNQHGIANSLAVLGQIAVDAGNFDRAEALLVESLLIRERLRERGGLAECFEGLAATIAERDPVRSARLLGVASRERENLGEELELFVRDWLKRHSEVLQRNLGRSRFESELEIGRRLTASEALELALSLSHKAEGEPVAPTRAGVSRFSDRQLEVINLVARGETNSGIALILGIGKRTVESHLSAIYAELGVSSRAAAIAHAHKMGMVGGTNRD